MYKLPDSLKAEQKEIIQCILAGIINVIAAVRPADRAAMGRVCSIRHRQSAMHEPTRWSTLYLVEGMKLGNVWEQSVMSDAVHSLYIILNVMLEMPGFALASSCSPISRPVVHSVTDWTTGREIESPCSVLSDTLWLPPPDFSGVWTSSHRPARMVKFRGRLAHKTTHSHEVLRPYIPSTSMSNTFWLTV